MALVAYDNSDSSEYEDDDTSPIVLSKTKSDQGKITTQKESLIEKEGDKNDNEETQNLFNQLPQPSEKMTVIEEDDEFLHKKATQINTGKEKSKITIPSLNDFRDVGDTVPTVKPKAVNGKKSGLLSILPQPKNGVKSTINSLIPNIIKQNTSLNSVKKKQPLPEVIKTPNKTNSALIEYSDESDDEVQNDFFSINKPVDILPEDQPLDVGENVNEVSQASTSKQPRSIESYFKKEEDTVAQTQPIEDEVYVSSERINADNVPESSNNNMMLDEEAILKLCGTRGKRKREEIQIVDINQQEVLNDAREMLLKGLMDDTTKRQSASKKRGNEPTSQQRRKHQITYLAHQAKANEAELQNQWANNRMTKRKTQSKYGF